MQSRVLLEAPLVASLKIKIIYDFRCSGGTVHQSKIDRKRMEELWIKKLRTIHPDDWCMYLTVTNENYSVTVELLKKSYDNQQIVITSHYTELLNLKQAPNYAKRLCNLYNQFIAFKTKWRRRLEIRIHSIRDYLVETDRDVGQKKFNEFQTQKYGQGRYTVSWPWKWIHPTCQRTKLWHQENYNH